jgi:DNA polymerase III alpha subunit
VKLEVPIVKLVIKDLVSYDGLKLELQETIELLRLERQKISVKDSVIVQMEQKTLNLQQIINKTNEQFQLESQKSKDLLKELKGQRRTTFLYKLGTTIGMLVTAILILGQ